MIETMYKMYNISTRPKCMDYDECPLGMSNPCDDCNNEGVEQSYPDFTIIKQHKLMKEISREFLFKCQYKEDGLWYLEAIRDNEGWEVSEETFSDAIAELVTELKEAINVKKIKKILSE